MSAGGNFSVAVPLYEVAVAFTVFVGALEPRAVFFLLECLTVQFSAVVVHFLS